MAKKYIIEGGYPLKGVIQPNGNKNAALPVIAATILSDEEIILRNIPEIEDVLIMIKIIEELGKKVERLAHHEYKISGLITGNSINSDLGRKIRTSILFAGPLLARAGELSCLLPVEMLLGGVD